MMAGQRLPAQGGFSARVRSDSTCVQCGRPRQRTPAAMCPESSRVARGRTNAHRRSHHKAGCLAKRSGAWQRCWVMGRGGHPRHQSGAVPWRPAPRWARLELAFNSRNWERIRGGGSTRLDSQVGDGEVDAPRSPPDRCSAISSVSPSDRWLTRGDAIGSTLSNPFLTSTVRVQQAECLSEFCPLANNNPIGERLVLISSPAA